MKPSKLRLTLNVERTGKDERVFISEGETFTTAPHAHAWHAALALITSDS